MNSLHVQYIFCRLTSIKKAETKNILIFHTLEHKFKAHFSINYYYIYHRKIETFWTCPFICHMPVVGVDLGVSVSWQICSPISLSITVAHAVLEINRLFDCLYLDFENGLEMIRITTKKDKLNAVTQSISADDLEFDEIYLIKIYCNNDPSQRSLFTYKRVMLPACLV